MFCVQDRNGQIMRVKNRQVGIFDFIILALILFCISVLVSFSLHRHFNLSLSRGFFKRRAEISAYQPWQHNTLNYFNLPVYSTESYIPHKCIVFIQFHKICRHNFAFESKLFEFKNSQAHFIPTKKSRRIFGTIKIFTVHWFPNGVWAGAAWTKEIASNELNENCLYTSNILTPCTLYKCTS